MQKIKFSFLSFFILFGSLTGCRSFDYVLPSQNQEINDMEIKPVINFNEGSFYDSRKCPYNYSYLLRGGKGETKNYSLDISCNNTGDVVPSFPLGLPFVLLNVFSLGIIPAVHKNEATLSGMLRYKDEPVKYYTANQTDHEASTIFYGYRFFDAGNMAKAESHEKAFFDLMKQIANDTDYIKEETKKIDKKVKERKEKEKRDAKARKEQEKAHNVLATASYAEKQSYCKTDEFKNEKTCYSYKVYTHNPEFSKYLEKTMDRYLVYSYQFLLDANGTLALVVNYSDSDWAFLEEAVDSDGKELRVQKIDSKVGHNAYVAELVGIILSESYLKEHIDTGIKIKIYGKRKNVVVFVPGPYVEGFYNYIQNNNL